MTEVNADVLIPKSLRQLTEEVLERFLQDLPEPARTRMLDQARREIGLLLCLAPTSIDAVEEMRIRASLAVGFGATYADAP